MVGQPLARWRHAVLRDRNSAGPDPHPLDVVGSGAGPVRGRASAGLEPVFQASTDEPRGSNDVVVEVARQLLPQLGRQRRGRP